MVPRPKIQPFTLELVERLTKCSLPEEVASREITRQTIVAIPTTRRASSVNRLLCSLDSLECKKLVVVSDLSDEIEYQKAFQTKEGVEIISVQGLRERCLAGVPSQKSIIDEVSEPSVSWDLPSKRNLAILYGTISGFDRLVLLDDDIMIAADLLGRAIACSTRFRSLGFLINEFPDLSVVDHIKRFVSECFQPFIAGNCLVINLRRKAGYFAPVYNEDWLFVFWYQRRDVGFVAEHFITQLEYDPFKPSTAEWQEMGETIATGMYELWASDDLSPIHAPDFWKSILGCRKEVLLQLRRQVSQLGRTIDPRALDCLDAAYKRSCELDPEMLVEFLKISDSVQRRFAQLLSSIRKQLGYRY